jgi:glycerol-3-phosphate acyltransferase PlsX
MGGDFAPRVAVTGARLALEAFPAIRRLYLVGEESAVKAEVDAQHFADAKLEIVHAPETVDMGESGLKSVKQKKKSSINVMADMVKGGDADAMVSAGNTAAMVASSRVKLRCLEGVEMPGIASPLPNEHGPNNILDAGANVHAKPLHLLHYAVMGTIYARHVQRVADPLVGLMSVGEEDEKGTDFTREVFALLREARGIRFIGNVEGHDLFSTPLHVTVCDGFTGNVVLKSCEATAKMVGKYLKAAMRSNPVSLLGGLFAKPAFDQVKRRTSYDQVGGSPLLGVRGVSIIAHGSSNEVAIMNAIRVAAESIQHEVNPHIEEAIAAVR